MSVFTIKLERVLRFSDEDLERYLDMCFDSILGVVNTEHYRMEVLNRIEAIHKEQQERKDASMAISRNNSSSIHTTDSSLRSVLRTPEQLGKRV